MELEYDQLLSWEDPGPAVPGAIAAKPDKPWGDGIVVSGANQPLKGRQTASLMADSYGFQSQEDLLRGSISISRTMADGSWNRLVADQGDYGHLPCTSIVKLWSLEWSLVPIFILCVAGQWSRQLHVCEH